MTKGSLVVIEGSDGSGKATQVGLLKKALGEKSVDFKAFDFPRYKDNIYGELAGRYLKGEFGEIDKVSPYLASLPFALDRSLAKPQIEKALNEGKLVLCNRYTASNKAHMGANLPQNQRREFTYWLDKVEYEINGLPRPDLTIFLDVPAEISQRNITREKDMHEENLEHLRQANEIYHTLSKQEPNWVVVECSQNSLMKYPEEIHQKITEILNSIITL